MGCGTSTPVAARANRPGVQTTVQHTKIATTTTVTTTKITTIAPPSGERSAEGVSGTAGWDADKLQAHSYLVHHADFVMELIDPTLECHADFVDCATLLEFSGLVRKHAKRLTHATHAAFFVAHLDGAGKGQLVEMDDAEPEKAAIPVPVGQGLLGTAAKIGQILNVQNPEKDARYAATDNTRSVRNVTGALYLPIMSVPLRKTEGPFSPSLLAVVQCLMAEDDGTKEPKKHFSREAEINLMMVKTQCAAMLQHVRTVEIQNRAAQQNKILLELAKSIFSKAMETAPLLSMIIAHAKTLLGAEGCSVFLLDKETNELIVSVFENKQSLTVKPQGKEIRFPIGTGIAGHVAATGEVLNIRDAYDDSRFNQDFDKRNNYRTKAILCMPIRNEGEIIGVAQVINKIGVPDFFGSEDVDVLTAFVSFCGIGIHNSLLYEKVLKAEQRTKVALEMISYHARVTTTEMQEYAHADIPSKDSEVFSGMELHTFTPRRLTEKNMVLLVLRMFLELGYVEKFKISWETLIRFVLTVKKNYRTDVHYHNFIHAVAVAHCFYQITRVVDLEKYLLDWEIMATFVASLCHDIDHRGKSNAFQKKEHTALGELYDGASPLEKHHFQHTMVVLRQEGNNIFEKQTDDMFKAILNHIKMVILSTDLANHFPNLKTFKETLIGKPYDKNNEQHRAILTGILMTISDLSVITKPWEVQRKVAMIIYDEFFAQGDEEKAAGEKPIPMFDREVANIPELQLGFIDHIALPTYTAAADFLPELTPLLDGVRSNRVHWEQELKDKGGPTPKNDKEPTHLIRL